MRAATNTCLQGLGLNITGGSGGLLWGAMLQNSHCIEVLMGEQGVSKAWPLSPDQLADFDFAAVLSLVFFSLAGSEAAVCGAMSVLLQEYDPT